MKKILTLLLAIVFAFSVVGCTRGQGDVDTPTNPPDSSQPVSPGSDEKRTSITYYYTETPDLNYLTGWGDTSPIVDGLITVDKFGVIVPNMATDWTKSDDGLVYTFKLRQGQYWYTNEGEQYAEITADDFITGMQYALTADNMSDTVYVIYDLILNAKAYYMEEITDFDQVGIKALDKYTLEYTLAAPCPYFIGLLDWGFSKPVNKQFLEEKGATFGTEADTILYSGPYMISKLDPQSECIYTLRDNYWNKENYTIKTITLKYLNDTSLQGELFQRGELDIASINKELVEEWVKDENGYGKWAVRNPAGPMTYMLLFNMEPRYEGYGVEDYKIAVNNNNFRKAILHSIDKLALGMCFNPFEPETRLTNTIVPSGEMSYQGKDYTESEALKDIVNANTYDPSLAREYKDKAMRELEGKVTFPIQLYFPYRSYNQTWTNAIQVMKQNVEDALGTDFVVLVLEGHPRGKYMSTVVYSGKFGFALEGWQADYADPQGWLDIFNGDVEMGTQYSRPYMATEYIEPDGVSKFTKLMREAAAERLDVARRYELLAKVDAFLCSEAFVIPFGRSGGEWYLTRLDPFTGNTEALGRYHYVLYGSEILEKPLGRDGFENAWEKYKADCKKALENAEHIQH